jgi:TrmH family RNA methyltransferase
MSEHDERSKLRLRRDNAEGHRRLWLDVHERTNFVLVRPHYPENVGAAARALKTMGFSKLVLVSPGRLAVPEHEMAQKMAVKSWDVLDAARVCETVEEAVVGVDVIFATTSRRGISGVLTPRDAAPKLVELAKTGRSVAILFGNEKTGLSEHELALAKNTLRIPMAADQPSINLAQAAQLIAYELFTAALHVRGQALP